MIKRGALFAAWALVGAALSYGLAYALTPYGLMIVGTASFAGLALPESGGSRWPECVGVLAGPGLLSLMAATSADDPADLIVAGTAIIAAALAIYAVVGRIRCARIV